MGTASSAKTVARAARAGGVKNTSKRRVMFPLAVASIVIVGVLLIVVARNGFSPDAEAAPKPGDHWHAAYGFFVCDALQPPITTSTQGLTGLHTHGDGIVHIEPSSKAYSGSKATLSAWGQAVGVQFASSSWTLPDGTKYQNGYDCNGQPAQLSVYKWNADDPNAAPQVFTSDFGNIKLDVDRAAFTFAVAPEGTEVPKPDSLPTLDSVGGPSGSSASTPTSSPTLTVPVSSSTTVPPPSQ
jgi:hypothetical protein